MNILQNENLIIESTTKGAELTRLYSKKLNQEILWSGDPTFWGRHSPILFPIVGRLKDNETVIEGNIYNMSQHGFARDMNFDVIDTSNNSITYQLASNSETKKLYPYSFELIIKYTLLNSTVNIEWRVINTDNKDIYFSIGAHPAFNLNFNSNNELSDYYLEIKNSGNVNSISLNGPYYDSITPIDKLDKLNLNSELFKNDALIYTNIDSISLKSHKCNSFINVNFKNFPLVGIWTPYNKDTSSTAPFLCIEPWYGLADNINTTKDFKTKKYINKLSKESHFTVSYSITIG